MISFVWDKICTIQKLVRIVQHVREELVVDVSRQLRRRGIVGGVQAEPNSTSYRCFETLLKAKFHYASWFGAGSEHVRS